VKKKFLFGAIALVLVVALLVPVFTACPKPPVAKDKIVLGQAVSLSGTNFIIHGFGARVPQTLWVDDVNSRGGIYLKDYGKKLPIEWIEYDDKSDQGTMVKLMEKLILEDKVDLLFPPCSTSWLFAAAPIANKYGYVLLGAEGGAESLEAMIKDLPYVFLVLNYSKTQMPVLADQFQEWGIKTAAISFLEDLHGVEYSNRALTEFPKRGIDVTVLKSHPFEITDFSPILKAAQDANVDAFCQMSYPGQNILACAQAIQLGYNPKVFFETVGPYAPWFADALGGASVIEGLIGGGAWNRKTSAGAADFWDRTVNSEFGVAGLDRWGNLYYWGSYQFLEQALVECGNLDQAKLRDIVATKHFETALGDTWFDETQSLAEPCHPGEIGQWVNGDWEVILPKDKATATPIFPKAPWPAPAPAE
jgi:branched-chain amino acid transport system substrate-binding protein